MTYPAPAADSAPVIKKIPVLVPVDPNAIPATTAPRQANQKQVKPAAGTSATTPAKTNAPVKPATPAGGAASAAPSKAAPPSTAAVPAPGDPSLVN